MLIDPTAKIHDAVPWGMFEGTLLGFRADGHGTARGATGPRRVVIPWRLLSGVEPGDLVTYRAKVLRTGEAVATSCRKGGICGRAR